jgi:hypothetical protein
MYCLISCLLTDVKSRWPKIKTLHHCQWKRQNNVFYERFQVLTAARMKFRIVFWDVLPCKIIVDRRFRGTYCLHHQGWSTIILHGSTSQKTILNVFYDNHAKHLLAHSCKRLLNVSVRILDSSSIDPKIFNEIT